MKPTPPTTTRLYETLVRLHDDVRQTQYPYSAKVLKWGIISESEIDDALIKDPDASEQTVWAGHKPADIASRLAGGLTAYVDQEGYRTLWMQAGLAEGSWKTYIDTYCSLKARAEPFQDDAYFRNAEMANFLSLTKILNEEVFSSRAMTGNTNLKVSLKSKWWKECHRVFADSVEEEVYRTMRLSERPRGAACHTPEWKKPTQAAIRKLAKRWVASPIWDRPQSTDSSKGVDFTSNNEATIKSYLTRNKFTPNYLEGRS
ncbi:hypothetical protein NOCA1120474 [metagenome]|uniref:Uncharacterized protein n=1 Tax=metagenome TaxID=256318 RepID=A0A2P2C5J7_9ZZZZ